MIELQTLEKLRPQFEIAWTYLPKPYIPEDKRSVYTRNTTANGRRNNVFAANKINTPQCNNIVSYDSALPVPKIIHDRKLIFCPATIGWSVPELIQVCPQCKDFLLHGCACNNEHLDVPRSHGPAKPCHHFHIVFTDGACTNNGKPAAKAGVGIAYGDDVGSRLSIPITDTEDDFPLRSNQRAELCAAKFGLELVVKARTEECDSEAEVWIIATDSEYVVEGMTKWLPTWKVRFS
jgi:ribonuclease HI